ncbi:MAG TPA: FecR domain-containing protein [Kofleriaceae bacterium]|nr:FecR domain-containing protein [Kofleriaceae bacterium]
MTRLGDKVAVEILEPARVARIEQHVLAELRATEFAPLRSRWSLARVAMPALAAAAVLAVAWLGLRALRPEVQRVALPGQELRSERITTADGGTRLDLGDAVIEVAAHSSFELRRAGGGILVVLEHGTVDCEVEPRGARPPFVVRAGEVAVTVVGTRFTVERGDEVKVHVVRGKVRVEAAGEVAMVAAGQGWTAITGVQVAAAEPAGRGTIGNATGAGPEAGLDVEGEVTMRDRVATTPRAPRDRPKPRGTRDQDGNAANAVKEPARFAAGTAVRPTLAPIMPSSATEPREAVGEYLRLAVRQQTPSKQAAWALYSKAYVEYVRLRQAGTALDTLDIFDRRFNAGAYTEDALKLRITITCGSGRKDACRGAAHKYLGRFPDGDYREHARAITNWDVTR